ncbi:PQQ-dependent sugar dehydrogenase [Diaphorobacter aerolatus]|uniref:PQQ-dependent sugar dehydrogenase n=1 Tax=Diaphorobacter aerolatus TaxID=1288495 RepID=A0A7H0GLL2_9BURK|nr:PQQ-dependent sugar dehydrogenase [Diaphorobacter aerolatus]QNP49178.1 PQQ-dependent sugar dehydrogenase [Diaphorobacter aerolatus]
MNAVAQPFPADTPLPEASKRTLKVETVSQGLEHAWSLAFLPGGGYLVTERPGRMRIVNESGLLGPALRGMPHMAASGQGGLLDVVLDRDFARNQRIFFCFSEPDAKDRSINSTALASATLDARGNALKDLKVLFSQQPKVRSAMHFGCRIVQDSGGMLFLTLGDRYNFKEQAQTLNNHQGKVVRIKPDGGAAAGNPLEGKADSLAEIWSWGHRNTQAATLASDGKFWLVEHGPMGGDELNLVRAGRNYGWPVITYGENYSGGRIGKGITEQPGMEQPVHYWVPSIAPSGMVQLTSDRYGAEWKGSLFIGSLKFQRLHRVQLEGDKVVKDEILLPDLKERVRDVRQGPDGLLYLLTDSQDGKLLRIKP